MVSLLDHTRDAKLSVSFRAQRGISNRLALQKRSRLRQIPHCAPLRSERHAWGALPDAESALMSTQLIPHHAWIIKGEGFAMVSSLCRDQSLP